MLKKIIGLLLVIVSIASLIVSFAGAITVWNVRLPLTHGIDSGLGLVAANLDTTQAALTTLQHTLDTTAASVTALQTTLQAAAQALGNGVPLTDSLAGLIGASLPNTISASQVSLTSAQASAQAIDATLTIVTQNPLLVLTPYKPTTTLSDALAGVSTGLGNLTLPMQAVGANLDTTSDDLANLETQLNALATTIEQFNADIAEAKTVVAEYQTQITQIQDQVDMLQKSTASAVNGLAWVLIFVLVWLTVAQAGLLTQGLHWLSDKPRA
jgi:uncharacterized coiled-coil protein SlyX